GADDAVLVDHLLADSRVQRPVGPGPGPGLVLPVGDGGDRLAADRLARRQTVDGPGPVGIDHLAGLQVPIPDADARRGRRQRQPTLGFLQRRVLRAAGSDVLLYAEPVGPAIHLHLGDARASDEL